MATQTIDKYDDYCYKIQSETEMAQAKWMIEQGLYKDLQDYIDSCTRMEIRIMKRKDTTKKKGTSARKKRQIEPTKKNKAA